MKLIDAIRNVRRPPSTSKWENSAPIEACCSALGVENLWTYSDELDERFKSYPILAWYCTDTLVGLSALYLDGEAVGSTLQTARKESVQIEWISREHAVKVRETLLSYADIPEYKLLNGEQNIGEDFTVGYVSELMTDDGFYQGRPVKVLVRYDGICGRTTDPKYRREGHSYTVSVPYEDPKSNCVLVQDGDEQRVIPLDEFRLAFYVEQPA